VTHNKGTMAVCEALFGITMEVKGVSRFVMVELDDVEEFVPEVNGGARQREEAAAAGAAATPEAEDEDEEAGEDAGEAPTSSESIDPESGEPVVELQPARAEAGSAREREDGSDREAAVQV